VALDFAAIDPIDWKSARGAFAAGFEATFPLVLGFDRAGCVEQLGPDADRFTVGDLSCTANSGVRRLAAAPLPITSPSPSVRPTDRCSSYPRVWT
jgi:NADPH:quinone reductase-like Zn-dependent oxidoreductase